MTDTPDPQMPPDPFGPVMQVHFPTLQALADVDGCDQQLMLEACAHDMMEALEQAHREDHRAEDGGGTHRRMFEMAVLFERTLIELYGDYADIAARMLVTFISSLAIAATLEELHE